MPDRSHNTFSLRRLNPFNGTLQVFTTAAARALSSNGLRWEIQILSDRPQGLWANMPFSGQQFYTFGLWSRTEGLRQVPLNPLFNIPDMLGAAQEIIEQLQASLERLPFPLADRHELWLLDEDDGPPVALLNSASSQQELSQKEVRRWIAAQRGEFDFFSPQLAKRGLPSNDGHNPRVHASVLEALVRERGGQNHRRGWYYRQADGAGEALRQDEPSLPAEAFPELPLTLDWEASDDQALIMDYITWKAPQILLLPGLSPTTRESIEGLAVKNAPQVDRLWRLYPEILNKRRLNAARVEAKIRSSQQT
ncbi:MAG: hypothetical protein ABFR65_00345 [Pseudomonadota bacterium]